MATLSGACAIACAFFDDSIKHCYIYFVMTILPQETIAKTMIWILHRNISHYEHFALKITCHMRGRGEQPL